MRFRDSHRRSRHRPRFSQGCEAGGRRGCAEDGGLARRVPDRHHADRVLPTRLKAADPQLGVCCGHECRRLVLPGAGDQDLVVQLLGAAALRRPLQQTAALRDGRHPGRDLDGGRGRVGGLEGGHTAEGPLASLSGGADAVAVVGVLNQPAVLEGVGAAVVHRVPDLLRVLRLQDVVGAEVGLAVGPLQLQAVVQNAQTLEPRRRRGQRLRRHLQGCR